jgi:hypothetical protein
MVDGEVVTKKRRPFFGVGFVWQLSLPETAVLRASKPHEAICNLGTTWLRLVGLGLALPLRLGLGDAGSFGIWGREPRKGLRLRGRRRRGGIAKRTQFYASRCGKVTGRKPKTNPNAAHDSGVSSDSAWVGRRRGLWLGDNSFHLGRGLAGSWRRGIGISEGVNLT